MQFPGLPRPAAAGTRHVPVSRGWQGWNDVDSSPRPATQGHTEGPSRIPPAAAATSRCTGKNIKIGQASDASLENFPSLRRFVAEGMVIPGAADGDAQGSSPRPPHLRPPPTTGGPPPFQHPQAEKLHFHLLCPQNRSQLSLPAPQLRRRLPWCRRVRAVCRGTAEARRSGAERDLYSY